MQRQCQKSQHELTAARQKLPRAWAPISLYLESTSSDDVVWMPAHTEEYEVGVLRLSDSQPLFEETEQVMMRQTDWPRRQLRLSGCRLR